MTVVLRRAEADAGVNLPPLTWDYWWWGPPGGYQLTAIVSCSRGHVGTAAPHIHTINADGSLNPSWVCPRYACDWHVFARLEGWLADPPAYPDVN